MMLYKYRKLDNFAMRLVSNGELYFSSPGDLNDPLDCTFSSEAALRAVEGSADERQREKLKEVSSRIYHDRVTGEKNEIFHAVEKRLKNAGILSFSLTPTEPLMWSHYANGHAGICVGIDRTSIMNLVDSESLRLIGDQPISYKPAPDYVGRILGYIDHELNGRPVNLDKLFGDLVVASALFTKSKAWEYEAEYRMIHSERGPMEIPLEAIREIIVGPKIDPKDRTLIESLLASPAVCHVRMRRADFKENSFSMEIMDI